MSKFNSSLSARESVKKRNDVTTNFEGGLSFQMDAKTRLYTRCCTALIEDKFYQTSKKHTNEIIKDIHEVAEENPEFVLKLAAYVRNEMYLRSVPIVILAEAANIVECKPYVRKWTPKILRRADEITELVGYWVSRYGDIGDHDTASNPFPNSLKKGIADSFDNFDEYQLDKYNYKGNVTFRDVLRIVSKKPKNKKQDAIFNYLVNGKIEREYLPKIAAKRDFIRCDTFDNKAKELIDKGSVNWEVAISQHGNKKEIWEALNLPIMAQIRNLRNMLNVEADMGDAISKLRNRNIIKKSRQLPFRFYSALKQIENHNSFQTEEVVDALYDAIEYSVDNIPTLKGKTFIACDISASMTDPISSRSSVTCRDIANLFGAMAHRLCESAKVGAFASDFDLVQLSKKSAIMDNFKKINDIYLGYTTDAWKAIDYLIKNNIEVDRIIIFSDEQTYDFRSFFTEKSVAELVEEYRRKINPNVIVYSIDLNGYGTSHLPLDGKVAKISGWSEKIFDLIDFYEKDKESAVRYIEKYNI